MRGRRFQRGSLQARKHGRNRMWVACWWEDGSRRSKVLGRCSQVHKIDAEAMLSAILQPINAGSNRSARTGCTFQEFVEEVYLPFCQRTWKESTAVTSEHKVRKNLVPEFGHRLLQSIGREELQDFLDRKALALATGVVKHLRWFLNAIFKLAQSDGLVASNPAAALRVPKNCQPGRTMRPLTEEEVNQYLEVFDLREKLVSRLAIFEGMRPGEIMALRWKSLSGETLRVGQRVYRGFLGTPKNGKAREGAISEGTLQLLEQWRETVEDPSPDAFVFPSEQLSTPLWADDLWRRVMKPKLEKVGLGWTSFQVLRKTNASLSKKAGVDPKVSADQRGHGIGVSLEIYTSSDLEQKRDALRALEAAVLRKPQPNPQPESLSA